jgi:mRNA interferase RelE/StbE
MLDVRLHKQAAAFLEKIPAKHACQIVERITSLQHDQFSVLSEDLKGFAPFKRFKSGEYRVVFFVEQETLHIPVIGKRNDDEVYDLVKRFLR